MKTAILLSLLILGHCANFTTDYDYPSYEDDKMDLDTIQPEISDGYEEATRQPTTEIIPPDDDLITRWIPWITCSVGDLIS